MVYLSAYNTDFTLNLYIFYSAIAEPLPGVDDCGRTFETDFHFRIAGKFCSVPNYML